MEDIKEKIKCSIANKLTLAGYLISAGSVIFPIVESINGKLSGPDILASGLSLTLGGVLIKVTKDAYWTHKSYRKAKDHIEADGSLDSAYKLKHGTYCEMQGIKLAEKEAGLTKKLI